MAEPSGVQACLDALEQAGGEGEGRPLSAILVEKGVLTKTQVDVLFEALKRGDELETIGGFQVIDKLGEGAIGRVYKARQLTLDRVVALKILSEQLASNPDFVARFLREARSAAKLDHPNIVRAIDAGESGGKYYFAMEFVEGRTLEAALEERGSLPEEEALGVAIQAARGLECAWRSGLVHRDIKPGNILITPEGVAKISDLGLAKEVHNVDAASLTQDGAAMGTPHYISPEQARGEDVDIRTDIYSLGTTLYRMATGRHAFTGDDTISIIVARFREQPIPADEVNPHVSAGLARLIGVMMAADREFRYPDPAVLLHDFDLLAQGQEPEFASESEVSRTRAIESARIRSMSTAAVTVVRRTRRGGQWRTAAAGMAAGAALILMVVFFRRGPPATAPAAPEENGAGAAALPFERTGRTQSLVRAQEEEARRALEAEAAGFYDARLKAFKAKEYGTLVEKLESVGGRYAATSCGPKLESLRRLAAAKIEEAARRAKEDAEREKRYQELLRLAREGLDVGDYATALGLLGQAKAVKETGQVKRLIQEATRTKHLSRGEDAERDGKLAPATALYKRALAIKDDPELRARVAGLERRLLLKTKLAEADGLAQKGSWRAAREGYLEALEVAREDEAREIAPKLRAAEREIRYLDLVEKAVAASGGGEWREALEAAREAAGIKPEAREPGELIVRARRALGPDREITNSIGMSFVLVAAGEFTMGSDGGEADERPRSGLDLDVYYIGKHEVTNAHFERFDPNHQRTAFSPRDDTPVVAVSWHEAVRFCRWLSEKEGIEYRLPTEAEWEKAARGADGRTYPWGDEDPAAGGTWRCNIAVGEDEESWAEDGYKYAAAVDAYPGGASPCGAHGLAGNVWEWCQDWYRSDYYGMRERRNPKGPASGKQRVLRGGSFGNAARHARCANRSAHAPGLVEACVGFRCVRVLDPVFKEGPGEER